MELILHGFGAITFIAMCANVARRNRYLKLANYDLFKIPRSSEINLIMHRERVCSKFYIDFHPIPLVWSPTNGIKYKETQYIKIQHKNDILFEYNNSNEDLRFSNFSDENFNNCTNINGEINFIKYCKKNSLSENNILVKFPILVCKKEIDKELCCNIKKQYFFVNNITKR